LEVLCQTSRDPAREPLDGVDLLLHFGSSGLTSGAWVATTLLRAQERLLASPTYLALAGAPQRPEDLTEHLLVTWDPPGEDAALWPLPEGRSLPVRPAFTCADVHLVRHLPAAGQGIARVPDGDVRDAPDAPGALVQVLPQLQREIPLRAASPEALLQRPKGRALFDLVRELAQLASQL
jgi:DNA-binding transcriptional LysR family regulator